MNLKDALDLYGAAANLVGVYWNLYALVALGLLGFIFTREQPLSGWAKSALTIAFVAFSLGNIGALVDKQTLREALGHEVVRLAAKEPPCPDENPCLRKKLSSVCSSLPDDCLHRTKWYYMVAFHGVFDLCVLGSLWLDRR